MTAYVPHPAPPLSREYGLARNEAIPRFSVQYPILSILQVIRDDKIPAYSKEALESPMFAVSLESYQLSLTYTSRCCNEV